LKAKSSHSGIRPPRAKAGTLYAAPVGLARKTWRQKNLARRTSKTLGHHDAIGSRTALSRSGGVLKTSFLRRHLEPRIFARQLNFPPDQ
jgi:hypothetical protein